MTTSEPDTSLADLLTAVRDHLARFKLSEPYAVQARSCTSGRTSPVSVHLLELDLPAVATALVSWADTLTEANLSVWRPPSSDAVHLQVSGRLAGRVAIDVWAGVKAPALLASLVPGQKQTLRLGLLRTWTAVPAVDAQGTTAALAGGAA
jgi:hypothetical protein